MLRVIMLLCVGVLFPGGADAGCDAAPLVRWVSTPPLLGGAVETRSTVQVHVDGCVRVEVPAQMRNAGNYRVLLDAEVFADIRSLAAAPELRSFDAAAKRAELDRTPLQAGASVHAVLDEDIVSLQIHVPGSGRREHFVLQWPSLRADRLNHPDDAALAAVDALHRRLAPLLSTAAARGERLP